MRCHKIGFSFLQQQVRSRTTIASRRSNWHRWAWFGAQIAPNLPHEIEPNTEAYVVVCERSFQGAAPHRVGLRRYAKDARLPDHRPNAYSSGQLSGTSAGGLVQGCSTSASWNHWSRRFACSVTMSWKPGTSSRVNFNSLGSAAYPARTAGAATKTLPPSRKWFQAAKPSRASPQSRRLRRHPNRIHK